MKVYIGIAASIALSALIAGSVSATTIEPKVSVSLTVIDSCRVEADGENAHVSCSAAVPVTVENKFVAVYTEEGSTDVRAVTITY